MNISAISTNFTSNNANNKKTPNFTSVVPFNVRINGQLLEPKSPDDFKLVHRILRAFSKTMRKNPTVDKQAAEIQREFMHYDVDYAYRRTTSENGGQIRNYVDSDNSFLITGWHAKKLEEAGKTIGKNKGLEKNVFEAINVNENDESTKTIIRKMIQMLSRQTLTEKRLARDPRLAPRIVKAQAQTQKTFDLLLTQVCGKIGQEKREAIVKAFTKCREDVEKATDTYFSRKSEIINSAGGRIRSQVVNRAYSGHAIELQIFASTKGSGKKSIPTIDKIAYQEIAKKTPSNKPSLHVDIPKVVFESPKMTPEERRYSADWPAQAPSHQDHTAHKKGKPEDPAQGQLPLA